MTDIDYILQTAHDEDELDPKEWPETTKIAATAKLYHREPDHFYDSMSDIDDTERERVIDAYAKCDYAEMGRVVSGAMQRSPLNWLWSQIEDHYWTWHHHRRYAEAADREWDRIREDMA
jgi:hypothetical protein